VCVEREGWEGGRLSQSLVVLLLLPLLPQRARHVLLVQAALRAAAAGHRGGAHFRVFASTATLDCRLVRKAMGSSSTTCCGGGLWLGFRVRDPNLGCVCV